MSEYIIGVRAFFDHFSDYFAPSCLAFSQLLVEQGPEANWQFIFDMWHLLLGIISTRLPGRRFCPALLPDILAHPDQSGFPTNQE